MIAAGQTTKPATGKLFLPLAIAWAALAAIGYYPTLRWAGDGGLRAMFAGQSLVIAVTFITTMVAMRRMVGRDAVGRYRVVLGAGAARLCATIGAAVALALNGPASRGAFLVWVAISYVVMIKVETLALIRWSNRLGSSA